MTKICCWHCRMGHKCRTWLVPSDSSEETSLAAARKIARAHGFFLEFFRNMLPILAALEQTIKLEPLFGKVDMMMFCFFQTCQCFPNCQPAWQSMTTIFGMRWREIRRFFSVARTNQNYAFANLWNAKICRIVKIE